MSSFLNQPADNGPLDNIIGLANCVLILFKWLIPDIFYLEINGLTSFLGLSNEASMFLTFAWFYVFLNFYSSGCLFPKASRRSVIFQLIHLTVEMVTHIKIYFQKCDLLKQVTLIENWK